MVLTILTISLIYTLTYIKGTPKLFDGQDHDHAHEYVKASEFKNYENSKYFDLEIGLDYTAPKFDDGKVASNGEFKFYFEVSLKSSVKNYVKGSAKIQVEADTYWRNNKLTSSSKSLTESTNWDSDNSFTKTNVSLSINKYFPVKPLFLVSVDQNDYYIFVKLSFNRTIHAGQKTEEVVEYLKITPKQWKELL